jgi:CheY-like chemotaxis protein
MYIVLVVDDDPVVRRAVARFVASAGYQVIESSTPEQGLAAADRYPVDLMITDLVMPNMTGYELAQRIAEIRPGVRVIYMSGFAPDELATERGHSQARPIFFCRNLLPWMPDAPGMFAMLAEDKAGAKAQRFDEQQTMTASLQPITTVRHGDHLRSREHPHR